MNQPEIMRSQTTVECRGQRTYHTAFGYFLMCVLRIKGIFQNVPCLELNICLSTAYWDDRDGRISRNVGGLRGSLLSPGT